MLRRGLELCPRPGGVKEGQPGRRQSLLTCKSSVALVLRTGRGQSGGAALAGFYVSITYPASPHTHEVKTPWWSRTPAPFLGPLDFWLWVPVPCGIWKVAC
jgi:hypothetical protein